MPDDPAQPERPAEQTPLPWYRKVRTWALATVVAAATTLVTTAIVTEVQDRIDRLSPPVDVAVQHSFDCPSHIVPGSADTVPVPPSAEDPDRHRWARDLGGADAGATKVQITVTGRTDNPVVLQDLRFDVLERRSPIDGILISAGCGDVLQERVLYVDLELTPPLVVDSLDDRNIVGNAPGTPEQPVRFPYTVNASSVEQFVVVARAGDCHCVWRARLLWTAGDRQGEVVIDDHGRPFVTHSGEGYPVYYSYAGEPLN